MTFVPGTVTRLRYFHLHVEWRAPQRFMIHGYGSKPHSYGPWQLYMGSNNGHVDDSQLLTLVASLFLYAHRKSTKYCSPAVGVMNQQTLPS